MSSRYILAHDIGTTGNKATLIAEDGSIVGSKFRGYETNFPIVGWAEQNPNDWWQTVCETTKLLILQTGVDRRSIACVTFSGQMMGCVLVDVNGNPLRNAIIWADMRAEKETDVLRNQLGMEKVYYVTGHRISSSYSGAKLVWVKKHQPELFRQAHKILHAKDFLVHKLTGKFATDYSDASGMNLFDIRKKTWSPDILKVWEIDEKILPDVFPSSHIIGGVTQRASEETGLRPDTPVVIGGGDGCCAAAGVGVVSDGDSFNYIGSSSWIALATDQPIYDPNMKTYTWIHLDPSKYSPNGTMQSAGASYQWLRDQLYPHEKQMAAQHGASVYDWMNDLAATSPPGANQLLYLPYLMGERSPRWNPNARGTFVGLHITHNRADMTRAVMEGVTFNLKVIMDSFVNAGVTIDKMWVLGGAGKSGVWKHILADIYGVEIMVPHLLDEATSIGAAVAGAVGVGILKDYEESKKWVHRKDTIKPVGENREKYQELYSIFNEAYEQLVPVYNRLATI